MPFTGFWDRWRRRHLQQRTDAAKQPSLRKTEKQREAAEREASKGLAAERAQSSAAAAARDRHSYRTAHARRGSAIAPKPPPTRVRASGETRGRPSDRERRDQPSGHAV
jgi:hypothetical protein